MEHEQFMKGLYVIVVPGIAGAWTCWPLLHTNETNSRLLVAFTQICTFHSKKKSSRRNMFCPFISCTQRCPAATGWGLGAGQQREAALDGVGGWRDAGIFSDR